MMFSPGPLQKRKHRLRYVDTYTPARGLRTLVF